MVWESPAPAPLNAGFELGTLANWTSYGAIDGVQSGTWFGGITAHTGNWFFGTAVNYGTKSGGLYQRIAVPTGYQCQAAAWTRVYHSSDNPWTSAQCKVGIDPTGGTNPSATSVKWSTVDVQMVPNYSEWRPSAAPVVACGSGNVTIFLDFKQFNTTGWHITCFDDAVLTVTAPGN